MFQIDQCIEAFNVNSKLFTVQSHNDIITKKSLNSSSPINPVKSSTVWLVIKTEWDLTLASKISARLLNIKFTHVPSGNRISSGVRAFIYWCYSQIGAVTSYSLFHLLNFIEVSTISDFIQILRIALNESNPLNLFLIN